MSEIADNLKSIRKEIPARVCLVAVSKTKPVESLIEAYQAGQRDFGENYVQELCDKQPQLPEDVVWHFIGHLQSNKVKYIAPFVSWIHAVDSGKLLTEIEKCAAKNNRQINCLLQVHIADEETKFGFDPEEIISFCTNTDFSKFSHVRICGLMGMASFIDDADQVRKEFSTLKNTFDRLSAGPFAGNTSFREISMGMSGDWKMAIEEGSTMVRIGSAIFGSRK